MVDKSIGLAKEKRLYYIFWLGYQLYKNSVSIVNSKSRLQGSADQWKIREKPNDDVTHGFTKHIVKKK